MSQPHSTPHSYVCPECGANDWLAGPEGDLIICAGCGYSRPAESADDDA